MKHRNAIRLTAAALCLCLAAACLYPSAQAAPAGSTVWGFSEGMALCELDGKWGYVNAGREVVIPIQYDSAVSFSLGLAAVELSDKLGVIRQDGTYLIRPEYDSLMPINCGLYVVQKGIKWGVVSILPFSDGQGGATQVLYDLSYDSIQVVEQGGSQVLELTRKGVKTIVPLFELPGMLAQKGAPSAQFPLNRGKLPGFSDVSPRDWYALWVDVAYNVGLMEGVGGNQFAPGRTLTVAEALKLAATLESRYREDDFHQRPGSGKDWYSAAVDYCIASGIITSGAFRETDYTRPVKRWEMACIFAHTSLAKGMPARNSLERVRAAVPDVGMGTPCAEEIYSLYAKGVLAGVDANLTFRPDGALTRAEAAAIVSRMARTEQRITLWNVSFFSRPAAQDALPAESAASEEAGPLPEEAPSP